MTLGVFLTRTALLMDHKDVMDFLVAKGATTERGQVIVQASGCRDKRPRGGLAQLIPGCMSSSRDSWTGSMATPPAGPYAQGLGLLQEGLLGPPPEVSTECRTWDADRALP